MAGRIDYQWVVRWLDDIGLPQYKDKFLEARLGKNYDLFYKI